MVKLEFDPAQHDAYHVIREAIHILMAGGRRPLDIAFDMHMLTADMISYFHGTDPVEKQDSINEKLIEMSRTRLAASQAAALEKKN